MMAVGDGGSMTGWKGQVTLPAFSTQTVMEASRMGARGVVVRGAGRRAV